MTQDDSNIKTNSPRALSVSRDLKSADFSREISSENSFEMGAVPDGNCAVDLSDSKVNRREMLNSLIPAAGNALVGILRTASVTFGGIVEDAKTPQSKSLNKAEK